MQHTDQQLQLALAKMLPEKIDIELNMADEPVDYYWRDNRKPPYPIGDSEWLHVCWLVEQTIIPTRRGQYNAELSLIASNRNLSSAVKEPEFIFQNQTASWQQRAEALCKVKGITV